MRRSCFAFTVTVLLLFAFSVLGHRSVRAAPPIGTIAVNSSADVVADDGFCTLREAVTAANTDTASGSTPGECLAGSGADTISLAAATYTLSRFGYDDDNSNGDLDVTASVTVVGADPFATSIDAANLERAIHILNGTVTLQDLTITNGHARDGEAGKTGQTGNPGEDGGGIYNAGALSLMRVVIRESQAGYGGIGGFAEFPNDAGNGGRGGRGGAIYSTGSLTLDHSIIENNQAGDGGDSGKNTVAALQPATAGTGGDGGGIYATGTLSLIYTRVINNRAGYGGIGFPTSGIGGKGGEGGGIRLLATTTLLNSEVSGNQAGNGGRGDPACGAGGNGGGIASGASVTINTSTVSGNFGGIACPGKGSGTNGNGGGLYHITGTLIISNGTVAANQVYTDAAGGGIAGSGTIGNTILANNLSGGTGPECSGTLAAPGGFVLVENTANCTLIGPTKGVITGQDPILGELSLNEGTTYTHALLAGSPALDKGDCPAGTTFDQRGFPRPVDLPAYPNGDEGCDIGAFEAQTSPGDPTPTGTAKPSSTPTVTRTATVTPTGTLTVTLTATPTRTPQLTSTPTHTPVNTQTPTRTGTPGAPTVTSTPSRTATGTITGATATATGTVAPTPTGTVSQPRLYLPLIQK